MKKVVVTFSNPPAADPLDREIDYWTMEGALSESAVVEARALGIQVTVFDRFDVDDNDAVLATIAMATLHNADWRELRVVR
ncbi:hypothetical protein [Methylopila sp. Yamaguchi]|uniref:hypothetical protein n=1 Tax=Methylopila sp. Yamaguchi TaxID=1437817 RepID=UPI000CAC7445|nr:hypothetical protein [Methylopila sp. Yamaguchi]GBD50315.1 hypothetical protein METY_3528 [Methylopila sp. Yamaguchi]